MSLALEITNLEKIFTLHILGGKKIHALNNLSFSLEKGEAIGLIGKSGSGKSTLMKCIYRTNLATNGKIIYHSRQFGPIDLVTANEYTILQLRKSEITYCSQFLEVIPRVTAVDIVAENLVKKGTSYEYARNISKELLHKLLLPEELWDAFPSTFSGGEQQRVNVAKAIIAQPNFLLIDEPTASLDPKVKSVVINLILDLKKIGTSIICISHDQFTLEKMSDRSLELIDGKIVNDKILT